MWVCLRLQCCFILKKQAAPSGPGTKWPHDWGERLRAPGTEAWPGGGPCGWGSVVHQLRLERRAQACASVSSSVAGQGF